MKDEEKFLKTIIVKAGDEIFKRFDKTKVKYAKKNVNDVVTEADLVSTRIITDAIKKNYPTHGMISEEATDYKTDSDYVWIFDPLDGTRNYSKHIPFYGVMIALKHKKDIILSAIYIPYNKDLYFAKKGKGAYLNGKRIKCSRYPDFIDSFGTSGSVWNQKRKHFAEQIQLNIAEKSVWINAIGTITVMAGYTADARSDWLILKGGGVWDYAAAVLILREAGCVVTNLEGKEWNYEKELVAANPVLHKKLLKLTKDWNKAVIRA